MTISTFFKFLFILLIVSCSTQQSDVKQEKKSSQNEEKIGMQSLEPQPKDVSTYFEIDDYPITTLMIENQYRKRVSENRESIEDVWFTDENQTIMITLATDLHRFVIYHLRNDIFSRIPFEFEFISNNDDFVNQNGKKWQIGEKLNKLIESSERIETDYFTTNKGFRLGDSKQKALDLYGDPDEKLLINKLEKLKWDFIGEFELEYLEEETEFDPIVKDSFGNSITMYFEENKLVAQVIFNDIP